MTDLLHRVGGYPIPDRVWLIATIGISYRAVTRVFPLMLALLVAPLSACPPDPAGCEPSEDDPTLEIGKGETEYEAMDAGDGTIEVINGPQGGYHVEVGFEATGLDAADRWAVVLSGDADGFEASSSPFVTMRCNNATATLQSWGHLLIWDLDLESEDGSDLDGLIADIHASATDASGTVIEADITVEMHYPDAR